MFSDYLRFDMDSILHTLGIVMINSTFFIYRELSHLRYFAVIIRNNRVVESPILHYILEPTKSFEREYLAR